MFHLMVKDIYVQRKTSFLALIILPLFLMFKMNEFRDFPSITHQTISSLGIAYLTLFMVMTSNFSTQESENIQYRLLLSLPIARKDVVNAKYMMIGVWWSIAYVICTTMELVGNMFFSFHVSFDARTALFSLSFAYVLSSLFYPIHFKFGYKTASLISVLLFFFIVSSIGKLTSTDTKLKSLIISYPIFTIAIFSFTVTLFSYAVSKKFFIEKDF